MMSKKMMMVYSHRIAKEVNVYTKNYSIALSFAMKYVWKKVKEGKKRIGDLAHFYAVQFLTTNPAKKNEAEYIEDIPVWLLSKNLDHQEFQAVQTAYTRETVRETEKAELIAFSTDFGKVSCWVPKSVIRVA